MTELTTSKIRVLVVDDSASVRTALSDIINSDPELEVMATATDPYVAVERIRHEVPDVIFLDIELPRMDGLTFLRKLMSQRPIPVVICSSLTQDGSDMFLQAMEAGAVDIVAKPQMDTAQFLHESSMRICDAAKAAAHARMPGTAKRRVAAPVAQIKVEGKLTADAILPPLTDLRRTNLIARLPQTEPLIAIGASTGGTEALREVLEALPETSPAILIVQHMPAKFTAAFARRLNTTCAVTVKEAEDGDVVLPGQVLIAPGNQHMVLVRNGARYTVRLDDGPHVARHRPSVDVLFRSVAQSAGKNALGMLLTGMGDDGANGLLEMRGMGSTTIAQDEATSVVYGMPKEAVQRGAAVKIRPLDRMAAEIAAFAHAHNSSGDSA
ncbi:MULTISPECIES: chemotaxis response regulator protein-glutamate methylesterase [unclassified Devosia]|uniref:protein-glutamate methylesterase/protein-glutamine glutaminase n=1 Tax=unclassified Devosia TaxID=196773 RepID=UPI00145F6078|nr:MULTISPECIES: chemotaxis response regulator protein-glutamate methylesterase [unclassified Devosia]MBJ6987745.1 chemotaxis response regulator protein-glutamate methylesterase [Devosia sp. MC521]MBJ7578594.1 chemotaxis response regulator protein-glutamate methylesterase [Devosia sp. MC532]QMW62419.1 chemotaxis response regulator protein-glutamate methylesterase [Devosia sp. MC521]